ncbi:vitamin K epoxide reductase family protein [Chitinophaga caseinilytica]|uniref:Vitamin K epoxide reductase family protein n=1 Tax=Chitinophaga caseinilytica TaxID=2267521 RepID=A0ABZ2Z6A7_9BACT
MAAHALCSLLDVPVTASTLKRETEDHPSYPSLLSISEVLTMHGVENICASFPQEQLADIPPPYIAQIKDEKHPGDYFTVVKSCNNRQVIYLDPHSGKWVTVQANRFTRLFTGVILLAEALPNAGEAQYNLKRREERWNSIKTYLPAIALTLITIAVAARAAVQLGTGALLPVMFTLLSLLGCGVGTILMWFDLDRFNPAVQQFCRRSNKVNCNAVLQSDRARFAGFSWSEIGISYFSGQLLFLLTQGISSLPVIAAAGWISLAALPYVFYSIFVQARVLKQWCLLCLMVQGILLAQGAAALTLILPVNTMPPMLPMGILAAFTASAFLLVQLVKPMLKQNKQYRHVRRQYTRLRFQPEVFQSILQRQRQVTHDPAGLGLVMGNPEAKHTVVKVCNPYCGPCATAHVPLHELAELNENVNIRIIFTTSENPEDPRRLPVSHLMAIAEEYDPATTKSALDSWYTAKEKDYAAFAARFPVKADLQQKNTKIAAMAEWCTKVGIEHTPTLFVDNYELPESYSVHDLRNFLTT